MSHTLLGRAGQPDDVARVITFLASDLAASRWVSLRLAAGLPLEPLGLRGGDILLLAQRFLGEYAAECGTHRHAFDGGHRLQEGADEFTRLVDRHRVRIVIVGAGEFAEGLRHTCSF